MLRLAPVLAVVTSLAFAGHANAAVCDLNSGTTTAWTCAASGDDVTISNGTNVVVQSIVSAKSITIANGSITFSNAATLSVTDDVIVNPSGSLTSAGTLAVGGTFDKQGGGTLTISDGSILRLSGPQSNLSGGDICLVDNFGNDPLIQVFGEFHIADTASAAPLSCGTNVDHAGLDIGFGGSLHDDKAGTIAIAFGIQTIGKLDLASGQKLDIAGRFDQFFPAETTIAPNASLGGLGPKGLGGGLLLDNGTVEAGNILTITGGVLRGDGAVTGFVSNLSGTIDPGDAVGTLTVDNIAQGPGGKLRIGMAGKTPGTEFDQLKVNNVTSLGGQVEVQTLNGFTPKLGDTFLIIPPSNEIVGKFAQATGAPVGLAFRPLTSAQGTLLETTLPPPANTSAPVIAGTPEVGQVLTCDTGSWTTSPTFTYEWLRNGNPLDGETAAQHAVSSDDSGLLLICRVTATNVGGSAQAESDPVRARDPAPVEQPAATPATPSTPSTVKKPTAVKKKLGKRQVCAKVRGQKICFVGPAALRSPACLKRNKTRYKFTVTASKKKVKVVAVKFKLDKKSAGRRKKKPYTATVSGSKLKKGRHKVTADGTYTIKKKTSRKKLTLSFKTC